MHTIKTPSNHSFGSLKTVHLINDEIIKIAKEHYVSTKSIDFDLISYRTFCKRIDTNEVKILENSLIFDQINEELLRSENLLIWQEYDVIFTPKNIVLTEFDFSLASSKDKCSIYALFPQTPKLVKKKDLYEIFKKTLYKKLLRNGFLIGIWSEYIDTTILKLNSELKKNGSLPKNYRLLVLKSIFPVQPKNDELIYHYKQYSRFNNIIDGVKKGTLVLEYHYPVPGISGRDLQGIYIPVNDPISNYGDQFQIDSDTMQTEETDTGKRYFSKCSGYVTDENHFFTIAKELQIDQADFKTSAYIEAGEDKDISLKINNQMNNEDAVGCGVNIDVRSVNIKGTIGRNTKIKAAYLKIEAQTHTKSRLYATQSATIHLHRGFLKTDVAHIDILESGTVEADTAYIGDMSGGKVVAKKVFISTLRSNADIIAEERIEIDNIIGESNNLTINPNAIGTYYNDTRTLKEQLAEKTLQLRSLKKQSENESKILENKYPYIKAIKNHIHKTLKAGLKPLNKDILHIKQFNHKIKQTKELHSLIQENYQQIAQLENRLHELHESYLNSEIINWSSFNGTNKITFINPKNQNKYSVTPIENNPVSIHLEKKNPDSPPTIVINELNT